METTGTKLNRGKFEGYRGTQGRVYRAKAQANGVRGAN